MAIKILVFGSLTDIIQKHELQLSDYENTQMVVEGLIKMYPALASKKFKLALNEKLIHDIQELKDGDTVALLPPFSGG